MYLYFVLLKNCLPVQLLLVLITVHYSGTLKFRWVFFFRPYRHQYLKITVFLWKLTVLVLTLFSSLKFCRILCKKNCVEFSVIKCFFLFLNELFAFFYCGLTKLPSTGNPVLTVPKVDAYGIIPMCVGITMPGRRLPCWLRSPAACPPPPVRSPATEAHWGKATVPPCRGNSTVLS